MKELNHKTGETLEGTRDTDRGGDLNQDPLCGGNVDL